MEYGYARVSTREQNEDRQLIALAGWGIQKKNIILTSSQANPFECISYPFRIVLRIRYKK